MVTEFAEAREFVRGSARSDNLIYILSKGKALIDTGIAHTSIIGVYNKQWGSVSDTDWDATAIAVARRPSEKLIVIGQDGDVLTYVGGVVATEQLPAEPTAVRNACTVEGQVYACGMKRQVYLRVDEANWIDVSAPYPKDEEEAGFEALDGFSASELYAIGWAGEIWHFNGTDWLNRASPTNVVLTAVCCAPDGIVYIAGQDGVMLAGRADQWSIIQWSEDLTENIWDLCWFQDKLYVATISQLYTFSGNRLIPVDFGDVPITTCYNLTTVGGVLWSIGRDDVASFDGNVWERYD